MVYAASFSTGSSRIIRINHIPADLVVDCWASDGESGSHRDFLFRPDMWTMVRRQISEKITPTISTAWYLTTKSDGMWFPRVPRHLRAHRAHALGRPGPRHPRCAAAHGDARHGLYRKAATMRLDGREREGGPIRKGGANLALHGCAKENMLATQRLVGTITGVRGEALDGVAARLVSRRKHGNTVER